LNPNEVKGYGKRSFPCCRVGGRILGRGKLPLLKSGATRDGSTPSSGISKFH